MKKLRDLYKKTFDSVKWVEFTWPTVFKILQSHRLRTDLGCWRHIAALILLAATLSANLLAQTSGTVVGWGRNDRGQISLPVGLTDVVSIVSGWDHTLALKRDGTVVGWGENLQGQATPPSTLVNATAVASGQVHSMALTDAGQVIAWGADFSGQSTPPSSLNNVIDIAAGGHHSLALGEDGTVVGWGDNSFGQLSFPEELSGVISIAAGQFHSVALIEDGTIVIWGKTWDGSGIVDMSEFPPPASLTNVKAIAAGHFHVLALRENGTVVAWGPGQERPPFNLAGVIEIAAGGSHNAALQEDGSVVAWGDNLWGQASPPARFAGQASVIAVGSEHSVAVVEIEAPNVVIPPQSQTVRVGTDVTLSVFATGSPTLNYQWLKDKIEVQGATNSVHIISQAQFSDAGNYSVQISNFAGSTTNELELAVGPIVSMGSELFVSNLSPDRIIEVPINFTSIGGEHSLAFSLSFDTNILKYIESKLGDEAPEELSILWNANQVRSGQVGIALALGTAGSSFSAGKREVAVVSFEVTDLSISRETTISFQDGPIFKELSDPEGKVLIGDFKDGIVEVVVGKEGDTNGDFQVTAADVTKVGRIAARLDNTILTGSSLFSESDIRNLPQLVRRLGGSFPLALGTGTDVVSEFIRTQFSPETVNLVAFFDESTTDPTPLKTALVTEFNAIIQRDSQTNAQSTALSTVLYDDERFTDVVLSKATDNLIARNLIDQNPQGADLNLQNRLLLEDVYPEELISHLSDGLLQRADSAPLEGMGDGAIGINDWVQSGRFAAAVNDLVPAGGVIPSFASLATTPPSGGSDTITLASNPPTTREIRVMDTILEPGQTAEITIQLAAVGEENSLGFTLNFDPTKLTFIRAEAGDLPQKQGSLFLANSTQSQGENISVTRSTTGVTITFDGTLRSADEVTGPYTDVTGVTSPVDIQVSDGMKFYRGGVGRLGILIALPAGVSFPEGLHDIVRVSFEASPSFTGDTEISFNGNIVTQEVASVLALKLDTDYSPGTLTSNARQ